MRRAHIVRGMIVAGCLICAAMVVSFSFCLLPHSHDESQRRNVTRVVFSGMLSQYPQFFRQSVEDKNDRWQSLNNWDRSSNPSGTICAPWLIECSARRLKLTTRFRKRGYGSTALTPSLLRISVAG